MEGQTSQNAPPVQPPLQTVKPSSTNWLKILIFILLGLSFIVGLVFIGIQIRKSKSVVQQLSEVVINPTLFPAETISPNEKSDYQESVDIGIGFGFDKETTKVFEDNELQSIFPKPNDFIDTVWREGSIATTVTSAHSLGIKIMCVNLSLEDTKTAVFNKGNNTQKCDYFGYNPEAPKKTQQTPSEELENFVESVKTFSELAHEYGTPAVIGPGYRFMSEHEDYYAQASKYADIWLIQTQVLTLDKKTNKKATPAEYREGIKKIIDLIHRGNPKTKIWLQIIISTGAPPEGTTIFTPEEITSYINSVTDIADAVRIYTGSDPSQIQSIIKIIKSLRS